MHILLNIADKLVMAASINFQKMDSEQNIMLV